MNKGLSLEALEELKIELLILKSEIAINNKNSEEQMKTIDKSIELADKVQKLIS